MYRNHRYLGGGILKAQSHGQNSTVKMTTTTRQNGSVKMVEVMQWRELQTMTHKKAIRLAMGLPPKRLVSSSGAYRPPNTLTLLNPVQYLTPALCIAVPVPPRMLSVLKNKTDNCVPSA